VIVVDSSVWVDYFRGIPTPQCALLDSLLGQVDIAVGDLIVAEVLQGVRDQRQFNQVRRAFAAFEQLHIGGHALAIRAAENFRALRERGITVRKTIDTLIATRCIEAGLVLLHADRDFDPFEAHLGLKVARA
jgi:predicted nucleic acid-binding protein